MTKRAIILCSIIIISSIVSVAYAGEKKPLKIFIMAGQSNMQGQAGWWVLPGLADTPETKYLYDKLVDKDGKPRVSKDVYVAAVSGKNVEKSGPLTVGFGGDLDGNMTTRGNGGMRWGTEWAFGVTMQEKLQQPILIIKASWGGKSLCGHFRPPSAAKGWVIPKDHPDHPDNAPKPLPIPKTFELPADFKAPKGGRQGGNHLQIMKGREIGAMNGIYPLYITRTLNYKMKNNPFLPGDVLMGINGKGLADRPVQMWRDEYFAVRKTDWMMRVTLLREGKVITVDFDTAEMIPGGREGLPAYLAAKKAKETKKANATKKEDAGSGPYYKLMMAHIEKVLADPGKYHPAYDPKQGVEIAGFVWFQGFNDMVDGRTYPNSNHPRGYEQYSWLLAHFIRDVRKDLKAPKLPFVIGVMGVGGTAKTPDPFREAMAAPAGYDEFKGTVAAVRTAQFVDMRIPEISAKIKKVLKPSTGQDDPLNEVREKIAPLVEKRNAVKSGYGSMKKRNAIMREIKSMVYTDEERAYQQNNSSSQAFHYHGSPKFMARTGEAFAAALLKLDGDDTSK